MTKPGESTSHDVRCSRRTTHTHFTNANGATDAWVNPPVSPAWIEMGTLSQMARTRLVCVRHGHCWLGRTLIKNCFQALEPMLMNVSTE